MARKRDREQPEVRPEVEKQEQPKPQFDWDGPTRTLELMPYQPDVGEFRLEDRFRIDTLDEAAREKLLSLVRGVAREVERITKHGNHAIVMVRVIDGADNGKAPYE